MNNAPIIIAGSGRSGTTWVSDAIAKANNLRTIFEPLQWLGVPAAKPFANKYVRDNAEEPQLKSFMDKVFSGRVNSLWTNYRILPDTLHLQKSGSLRHKLGNLNYYYKRLVVHYLRYHKIKSNRLIVKFTHANLMVGWLSKNYGSKILLIVRHPAAVVASKIRLGGRHWQYEVLLKRYFQDKQLMYDYLNRFKDVLTRSLSPVAGHTVIWCIENALPIHNAKKYGYCVVFYEDLIVNSDIEWKRIINALQLRNIPDRDFLLRPSQQAQVSREIEDKLFDQSQISRWLKILSKQQLAQVDQILNIFDISIYKAFDPMPSPCV